MTAKTKSKGSILKQCLISALLGVGVSFAASLLTAWIAMKTGDPLSVAGTMAAVCAFCGGFCAAILGSSKHNGLLGGVYALALYTALCVLMSLCLPDRVGNPLIQIGVSALGGLGGVALTMGKGGNSKKKIKKYVKPKRR